MAKPKMEPIWNILGKYDINIEAHDQELLCIICKKILIQPRVALCSCKYCYICYEKVIKDGAKYCFGNTENCRTVLLDNKDNIFNDERIDWKISKMYVTCPGKFCEVKARLEEMTEHMKTCNKQPKLLHISRNKAGTFEIEEKMENLEKILQNVVGSQEDSKKNIVEMSKSIEKVLEIVQKLNISKQEQSSEQKQELETNTEHINNLSKRFEEKLNGIEKILKEIATGQEKVVQDNVSLKSLEARLTEVQASQNYGEYLWCIKNWKDWNGKTIYSDPFYSYQHGYKMCLELLIPAGETNGSGSHLSLYVCIMQGEYDDILLWPFPHGVKLELLDRKSTEARVSKSVTYEDNPTHCAWNKPTKPRNTGNGFAEFIDLSELPSNNTFFRGKEIWIKATFLKM